MIDLIIAGGTSVDGDMSCCDGVVEAFGVAFALFDRVGFGVTSFVGVFTVIGRFGGFEFDVVTEDAIVVVEVLKDGDFSKSNK